jgi:hypothetical protein
MHNYISFSKITIFFGSAQFWAKIYLIQYPSAENLITDTAFMYNMCDLPCYIFRGFKPFFDHSLSSNTSMVTARYPQRPASIHSIPLFFVMNRKQDFFIV